MEVRRVVFRFGGAYPRPPGPRRQQRNRSLSAFCAGRPPEGLGLVCQPEPGLRLGLRPHHRETADQPEEREPLALSYRSYLFVPADSPRKLARAAESGADAVILDLEDAVAPANKAAARTGAARFLTQPAPMARFVRVNGLTTKLTEDDVAATAAAGPDGYVLPKCEIGRAHVCTPVTNAHLVFRLLLDKK